MLERIPVDVKNEGLAIESLRPLLKGRWRGNARAGEIGLTLSRLGYRRVRHFPKNASSYVRWYPPNTPKESSR
jgi:hypothetical protein